MFAEDGKRDEPIAAISPFWVSFEMPALGSQREGLMVQPQNIHRPPGFAGPSVRVAPQLPGVVAEVIVGGNTRRCLRHGLSSIRATGRLWRKA